MNRDEMMNKVVNATDGWLVKNAIWSNKVVDLIESEIAAAEKRARREVINKICETCKESIAEEGLTPDCVGFNCAVFKILTANSEKEKVKCNVCGTEIPENSKLWLCDDCLNESYKRIIADNSEKGE